MGFPSVIYCVVAPQPLVLVLQLLHLVVLAVSSALAYVGVRPSGRLLIAHDPHAFSEAESHVADAAPALKQRLPVVQFARLSPRTEEEEAAAADCAVCLGALEAWHEVRELGRCRHAFHRRCIDRWVDLGRRTCPLCRALLAPPREREGLAAALSLVRSGDGGLDGGAARRPGEKERREFRL